MEQLDHTHIDQYKHKLLQEKKYLESHLARIATKDPNVAHDYDAKFPSYTDTDERDSDRGEDALEVTDYVNRIGVENVLELRLAAVERALDRITKGEFGKCSNCDKWQPKARLDIDPAVERCLHCKKLA